MQRTEAYLDAVPDWPAEERALLRAVFEVSPMPTAILGDADRLVRVNPAFCALTGRDAGAVLGRRSAELAAPVTGALAYETRFVRPDGATVWADVRIEPLAGPSGRMYRLAKVTDVTERRRAEADAARRTRALLSTIEAQRAVTAAAHDRDLVPQVVAEQTVAAFPAAGGAAVEMLDGDELLFVAGAGSLAAHIGVRVAVAGSLSGVALAERRTVSCDDTATDPRVNRDLCERLGVRSMCIAPLFSADEPVGVLKVASGSPGAFDDADAHQLEVLANALAAALRHADDYAGLKAANRLKLDIIGMLGHEINNPLSAILGYADLLTARLPADSRQGRAVEVIGRNAERLGDIVREVLAMVAIDAGNISAARQPVALRTEIVRALQAGEYEHVPVHGPDVPVLFHPGHLQQIMVNLLSNAAKYAGGATAVCVEPAPAGRVLVRVVDQGPGVPEEFRPRLFERLARADRDADTVRGTGLGLYIVRSLARANDGDVRHEPGPDGGSVFVLDAEAA